MSAITIDHLAETGAEDVLAMVKLEYMRVYGRLPRIGRSGLWIIIDYTALRAGELDELLESLRASPGLNGVDSMNP
jgi:hypothetical protein